MSRNGSFMARAASTWLHRQSDDGLSMGSVTKGRAGWDCSKNTEPDLQNAPKYGSTPSGLAVSPRCRAAEPAGKADPLSHPASSQCRTCLHLSPTIGEHGQRTQYPATLCLVPRLSE